MSHATHIDLVLFLVFPSIPSPHSLIPDLASRPVRRYSDDFISEQLRLLSEVFRRARERQSECMREYKRHYDRRHRAKDIDYRPGDRVWFKNLALALRWTILGRRRPPVEPRGRERFPRRA